MCRELLGQCERGEKMQCPDVQVLQFLCYGSLTLLQGLSSRGWSCCPEGQGEALMGTAGWQTKYSLSQKLTTVLRENEPRAALLLRSPICGWQSETMVPPSGTSPRQGGAPGRILPCTPVSSIVIASSSPSPKSSPCNLKGKRGP